MTTEKKNKEYHQHIGNIRMCIDKKKRTQSTKYISMYYNTTEKKKDIVIRKKNKYRGLDEIKHKERNNK
jgi:hypothetical protein